jgi:predicted extracellular nuclease
MAVWINEFHYDNTGFDSGEFIELAGTAGTSLSGWQVVRYNGNVPSAAVVYTSPGTITLGGTLPNQSNGYGTLSFTLPQDGLQNGPNDGFALVDNTGAVVQLLSYEGVFTASNGPAAGLTSTDIGVSETGSDPVGGSSLALTGTGTQYSDFTWTKVTSPTSGAVNGNEFFAGSTASLSISDASVTEGNGGTALLTFTVTRSDASTAFTVHYATADGTATAASGDYVAQSGDLTFTAGGALSQTISVVVNGDTVAEPDETLTVALSGLVNQTGTTAISDGSGLGTIRNDDVALTAIYDIQGEGHKSPFVGGAVGSFGNSGTVRVSTEGVVTAIAANGFYLQDATGDGKDATSDGIFVFTGGAPAATITVGETVRVLNVRVDEFRPGGSGGSNNLTITELNASVSGASIQEMGGHTEIAPVLLGPGGREIPQGAISSNGFATYDPATYAIDFWETLEGMLVKVPSPVTVSATNEFRTSDPANPQNAEGPPNEEIWVVPAGGYDAASQTARGGLIIGPTDYNPERIQIDDINPALDLPNDNVGTHLSDVTGVVNYDFANYEVLVSQAPTVTQESTIQPETTALTAGLRQVTIGDYNVQNLDPVVETSPRTWARRPSSPCRRSRTVTARRSPASSTPTSR